MQVTNTDSTFTIQRRGYSPAQVDDYILRLHAKFERNVTKIDQQQVHIEKLEHHNESMTVQFAATTLERDRIAADLEELSLAAAEDRAALAAAREQLAAASAAPTTGHQLSVRLEQILTLAEQESERIASEATAALEKAVADAETIRGDARQEAKRIVESAENDVRQIYSDRDKIMSDLTEVDERLGRIVRDHATVEPNDSDSTTPPDKAETGSEEK